MGPKRKQRLSSIMLQYGLSTYDIHSCRSIYKKIAAYRVLTDKGTFLLKPFKGTKARLKRVYARNLWLKKHSFNNMPQWLTTRKGKHWTEKNGRLYYVTEWIDGSTLGENGEDYERLGEVLAQLHLISRRRSLELPSFTIMEIDRFKRHHRRFARHLPAIRNKRDEVGMWFREQGEQCLSLAEEAWTTLRRPDVLRILQMEKPTYIHGDVTSPNVILNSDGVYLVDWELSRRGSAYYEIAKTFNNVANFSVPTLKAFLAGYEKQWPLTSEERLIIASLSRLPREAWFAARQIRSGMQPTIFKVLKETWPKRMEVIRWLDEWARPQPQEPVNKAVPVPEEGGSDIVVS